VSAPRVINNCLPISTTLDQLGRIGGRDRPCCRPRGAACRAGVHGDTDIRLRPALAHRWCRRRTSRPSLPLACSSRMSFNLSSGRRLRQEIIDAGFRGDRRSGHRIVAGDHHGADAHATQFGEAFADAALDDVLEVHNAKQTTVLGDGKRRAAGLRDPRPRSTGSPGPPRNSRWTGAALTVFSRRHGLRRPAPRHS